ncbi:MAG: DNA-3-methyladenine glycosylase 2 family protein [Devosia sp.]|uniref:DNA-3-methyladenine glycosylase family protein n=1 Tax=Devosia sp. TaxID=1871048 RepID=UPI0024CB7CB7|nr:DNA-3-methyladenine glycosylase 2 family protein [Devosia sp.]UYN98459.1 MAG: DNA-3-methyladenine glycosylase 2 family protein [Devosia sp.]
MTAHTMFEPPETPGVDTSEAIAWHLDALVALAPSLAPMRERAGRVEPRINPKGFAGMAKVICGQQLSVQSAAAIWARFEALPGALDPQTYLALDEDTVRQSGFSRAKFQTLGAVAAAVGAGDLDLAHIDRLPAEEAIARLTAIRGIGPWTAEVYLLFCAGHKDIFPAGDLALLKAAQHGLAITTRPTIAEMIDIARKWSPHRSAAALLLWRYFAVVMRREGVLTS